MEKKTRNSFLYPDMDHSVIHSYASLLLDNYSSATIYQINHVINQNNRSLDLCFVSAQDMAPFLCEAPTPLVRLDRHHPPLLVTLSTKLMHDFNISPATVSYDFRNADHGSIAELLSNLDWDDLLDTVDIESAAQTISNVLAYIIDRHVPKKIHHHTTHPPWHTSEFRRLKSRKRAALRKFTKHRTLSLQRHYVRINHAYKRVAKRCFLQYRRGLQRKLKSRPKQFWKFVNEQRHEAGLPSSMIHNGNVASSTQDICQLFSEKFASVFTDERLSDDHARLAASYVPLSGQTMSRIDINPEMFFRASSKLKSSYNPGPDGIPSAFLKTHLDSLLSPLLHVFQRSVDVGVFPSCWKLAHMFPVHKKATNRTLATTVALLRLALLLNCSNSLLWNRYSLTVSRILVSTSMVSWLVAPLPLTCCALLPTSLTVCRIVLRRMSFILTYLLPSIN